MPTNSIASAVISHLFLNSDGKWIVQDNKTHCQGVAVLAREFAAKFGLGSFGFVAGTLHDLGKCRKEFQRYISLTNGLPADSGSWSEHNHAYVGMLAANKMYAPQIRFLLGSIIEGHHRGLYDCDRDRLAERLGHPFPNDVNLPEAICQEDLLKEAASLQGGERRDFHMTVRMLFSSLVDADYLDTEAFMSQRPYIKPRNQTAELFEALKLHVAKIEESSRKSDINDIRHFIAEQCLAASQSQRGIFSLTVPTGGGKTISSLVWAIAHALKNGMERIIVAIPYTSIIEQTAQILRSIFGEDAVLEHHSLMDLESNDNEYNGSVRSIRQKTGNWDAPIIVTTNVQLFESLFSHKPSKTRKLHNICNSVIILDEAQALPVSLLNPIMDSLDTLVRRFNCSVLISTATQPVLGREHCGTLPNIKMRGFKAIKEIIPPNADLFGKMKRVDVSYIDKPMTYDEIAESIMNQGNVLCIVNTQRDAYEIYKRLPQNESTIHLSKNMYPVHIKRQIGKIKQLLKSPRCSKLKVVSTQLIEAGVDIDFPVVMRQEAGLDSIIQAAGRCNREGKMACGNVTVFRIEGRTPPPGMIARGNDARRSMPNQTDIHNPLVIEDYYTRLYRRCDTFDRIEVDNRKQSVCELLYGAPQFETVGNAFRLINDCTRPIIISCDDNIADIDALKAGNISKSLLKRLSLYSVSVREYTFNKLLERGMVECWHESFYVLENRLFYGDTGIRLDEDIAQEVFII